MPPSSSSELAVEHWNKAPLYVLEKKRYQAYPWLYKAAEFQCHSGESVLELGCGTGSDLLQFAKNGANCVGLDVTPEHLRLARQRLHGMAKLIHADGTQIPFGNATFDYVYSHGVLHHCDRPRLIVEEIFRVLRPGGRFNIHVYARWSYFPLGLFLKHGRDWKLWIENSRDPVHIDLYTARMLRRLFQPATIKIRKYECKYAPALSRWIGWYLVVTGERP